VTEENTSWAETLRADPSGAELRVILVLPPNLRQAVDRAGEAVVKLEVVLGGECISPERLSLSDGYSFSAETARVLWLLQCWCGRWPGSILQLSVDRLEEIRVVAGEAWLFKNHGESDLLPVDSDTLQWIAEKAKGLRDKKKAKEPPPKQRGPVGDEKRPRKHRLGTIDGSEHFLAIELPARDHPAYSEIREAVQAERFKLEPSNRKWWLRDRHRTLDFLGRFGEMIEGKWQLQPTRNFRERTSGIPRVKLLIAEVEPQSVSPESWGKSVARLNYPESIQMPALEGSFLSRLREYQKMGVGWFWNLHREGLGGLLADEMGLGKTVQSLGLVAGIAAYPESNRPSLVICPASLVENWMREASEFIPGIRRHSYFGAARDLDFSRLGADDLIVTSYGTLRADRALFLKSEFSTILADEAQVFKNPSTETSRVMRKLRAGSRFALTGTPIENSITDLWGIGQFALPGVFGSELPPNPEVNTTLAKVRPYLLRRTKAAVLRDLPEKWESRRFVRLSGIQSKLYQKIQHTTEQHLFALRSRGAKGGRLSVEFWTELLRLRQVTAEPRIFDPELPRSASAKAEGLLEIIAEVREGGGRLLVFSQFTQTLKWLCVDLEEEGIPYLYLDGSTRDRQARVDRFNRENSIPVFLLSLKAGGTGLNLTGADTVVHYDPWWNPAAEAQATDRAHRIGQTRKVQSIKLIGSNTVEEKVVRMQEDKKALLGELFESEGRSSPVMNLAALEKLLARDA